jgi:site-specific recombinase XerD
MRHLGIALRPHAFRHIAATSIAEYDPEHVNIIRDILGHASLNMAQKHYNRATGISSCNGLQSIVEDFRKAVPIMSKAKRVLTPPNGVSVTS